MTKQQRAKAAIDCARGHLSTAIMETSARVALRDAVLCYDEGAYEMALLRARIALAYAVGICHPDYQRFL
jgi:hypothetical protein